MRAYEKREKQQLTQKPQGIPSGGSVRESVPNSALEAMYGMQEQGGGTPDLGLQIQARLLGAGERPQAQILQAEDEAERLSASVRGGSPDAVKSAMGQRMGADFSGVRFHTGAAAAAKADAMGARAYTSGGDVYFGAGGFDPAVAAHELVHTVQQGVVSSGVDTMATPVGGVQMLELRNPFKKRNNTTTTTAAQGGAGGNNAAAETKKESLLRRGWDKTGGRVIRKHRDALDELYDARNGTDKDWEDLTVGDRAKWVLQNPLAYAHYKLSGQATIKKEVDERKKKRKDDRAAAKAFLKKLRGEAPANQTSLLTKDANGQFKIGLKRQLIQPPQANQTNQTNQANQANPAGGGTTVGDVVDKAADIAEMADNAAAPADAFSGFQEAGWVPDIGANAVSGTLGGLKIATGAVGAGKAIKELMGNWKESTGIERTDMVADLLSSTGQVASGIAAIGEATGLPGASLVSGGLNIATGGLDVFKGGRGFYKGWKQSKAMKEFNKGYANQSRGTMAKGDLAMMDSATIGEMEGDRRKVAAAGQMLTGAMDMAAGVAKVSGAGAGVGAALGGVSAATKGGFAIADHVQRKRMKKKMVEQTTGLSDDVIRRFQNSGTTKRNFSRAKQALMQELGYESGKRSELFADQTELRSEYLANKANAAAAANNARAPSVDASDAKAEALVTGLGIRQKGGSYSKDEIAEQMGHRDSREKIRNGTRTIHRKAVLRRQNRAAAAAAAASTP